MSKNDDLYPQTAFDALAAWDRGESVFTVELGGIGPGYEMAIQMLAFELIRAHGEGRLALPPPETPMDGWGDEVVHIVNKWPLGGFSGAQVGAAKWLAYRTLREGWAPTLTEAHARDQTTLVSRHGWNIPEAVAAGGSRTPE